MTVPTQFLSEIIALFGSPVAENPTQYMQEEAFRAAGLDFRYVTLEVRADQLGGAVQGLRAMNFTGANCTIPHKVAVIPLLDSLTEAAERIGAVNTIVRQTDGSLLGENTDGKGFIRAVRESGRELAGGRALLLGAGGAARAIAIELALAGASEILIANRTPARGEELVQRILERTVARSAFIPWDATLRIPDGIDFVVNATSIGLYPDVGAIPNVDFTTIRPEQLVCDVIPNPPRTPFLRAAEKRGATALDGLGMLVYQGAIAFKLWTGHEADVDVMRRALERVFAAA